MDKPNEYEQAIEDYAEAVHAERSAKESKLRADAAALAASEARQEKWRIVSAYVTRGLIKPGIYRLALKGETYADGILIEKNHDYPEIFPMFR